MCKRTIALLIGLVVFVFMRCGCSWKDKPRPLTPLWRKVLQDGEQSLGLAKVAISPNNKFVAIYDPRADAVEVVMLATGKPIWKHQFKVRQPRLRPRFVDVIFTADSKRLVVIPSVPPPVLVFDASNGVLRKTIDVDAELQRPQLGYCDSRSDSTSVLHQLGVELQ